MGAGAVAGTEGLSDETQEELAKLSETARKELEAKKMLADVVADQKKKLADDKKLADEKEKAMAEEIEKLRAELKKDKDEAPPSPVKQPLSEADAEAVNKIEQQARRRTRRPSAPLRSSTSTS